MTMEPQAPEVDGHTFDRFVQLDGFAAEAITKRLESADQYKEQERLVRTQLDAQIREQYGLTPGQAWVPTGQGLLVYDPDVPADPQDEVAVADEDDGDAEAEDTDDPDS